MENINTMGLERISKKISSKIEDELNNLNLFFRVFHRYKSSESLIKKLDKKEKDGEEKYNSVKKIQDVIGQRINLYFADDIEIVKGLFKEKFVFVDETIDRNATTEFKPTRINLIFKIPKEYKKEFRELIKNEKVDDTFELQLRTVLSEGWHEVDHDLRYKCSKDWDKHDELSRMFNGILASLETNDWSMLQLFNELSFRHYKNNNLEAMLRTKFRIRLNEKKLNDSLIEIIKNDGLQRALYKLERSDFLNSLKEKPFIIPMNIENLIFILNIYFLKNEAIFKITPELIMSELASQATF